MARIESSLRRSRAYPSTSAASATSSGAIWTKPRRRKPRWSPHSARRALRESRVAWPSRAPTSRTTCCGRRFAGSIRKCVCSRMRSRKPPSGRFSTGTSPARTYGCSATAHSSGTRSSITRSDASRGCTAFTAASACGRTSTALAAKARPRARPRLGRQLPRPSRIASPLTRGGRAAPPVAT